MRRSDRVPLQRFAWTSAAFALTTILASCGSPTRWERESPTTARPEPAPVVRDQGQPPRSARGNPAFYEVFGQRYYVKATSAGYRERGVASWYGKKFHGKPTSSGEPYNMHAMTAAHKTLPLPTRVRVTNLSNGRSVIVMVNDRGPFVHNRVIDMSYAAATRLDMIRDGTALVEVEALPYGASQAAAKPAVAISEPAPTPADTTSPAAVATAASQPATRPATPARTLYLQVGAFGEQANAYQLKERLEAGGVANVVIHYDGAEQPSLYRVRLGPIVDVDEYDELVARVADLNILDTHLVTAREMGNLQ
ncbi:MAG: septal ring lytic transglycosylase RlpA family protein [Gammaproteobacteria bacterium]|nr:septal ring lytic transglycosylase RlpA family protein [Gammaproteobacteria bacterium]